MNVCKVKRNSMTEIRKMQISNYSNKHDKNVVKNNLNKVQLLQNNNNLNSKKNNNLYIKSEFNLQKTNSDPFSSLTYIKSLPSHIVKKKIFYNPNKN